MGRDLPPEPAWAAATDDLWTRLDGPTDAGDVTRSGTGTGLVSPLPVEALAMASVGVAGRAAALWRGVPPGDVVVDAARVGGSFRAERLVRIGGETPAGFAPLSGFFAAADGWVRTHANYPHHRARLLAALGVPDDAGRPDDELVPDLRAAIAERPARGVERQVTDADGIAVAVRTRREWDGEPQGRAVAAEPLVGVVRTEVPAPPARERPRVLDLTRVLAGPVGTRTLGLAGADVLRVDPPELAELAAQHVDTGIGKRTTVLDARSRAFRELLGEADVLVTGYRPDGVRALGLDPQAVLAEHPHLVVVRLDAWGWSGPWAQRRGFDSIVQAACGVADLHRIPDRDGTHTRPGALPCQALDYATGYLAAAAALLGLSERPTRGGSVRDLALARTADWLFTAPRPSVPAGSAPDLRQSLGSDEVAPPALLLPGRPHWWESPARPIGADPPSWDGGRSGSGRTGA